MAPRGRESNCQFDPDMVTGHGACEHAAPHLKKAVTDHPGRSNRRVETLRRHDRRMGATRNDCLASGVGRDRRHQREAKNMALEARIKLQGWTEANAGSASRNRACRT